MAHLSRSEQLIAVLARAWQLGYSVQLSPLIQGERTWIGRQVAIYLWGPGLRKNEEPWSSKPCAPNEIASILARLLDKLEMTL